MNISGDTIGLIGLGVAVIAGYIKLRERLVSLEVKVSLYWETIAKNAAQILHTPHPENMRRDELLEKFVEANIKREELIELIGVLKNIIDEKTREFGERNAANTLLTAIKAQYEL